LKENVIIGKFNPAGTGYDSQMARGLALATAKGKDATEASNLEGAEELQEAAPPEAVA
jgi:hypothetical protein